MTARYRVTHVSRYTYNRPVLASFNEARLSPAETPWQTPLETTLTVEPASWRFRYTDYWGTQVRVFEAHSPHASLDVQASSLVEVDPSRRPAAPDEIGWDGLHGRKVTDRYYEFLTETASTAVPEDLAATAADLAATGSPARTARALARAVHEAMTYETGSTEVHTTGADAWVARRGVCQDYAHLVVGALRHVGIPARYVSGYMHPDSDPEIGVTVSGESHAWVEWWLGAWTAFDPTAGTDVAEHHITVGSGRDYHDVPPIKGVVAGKLLTSELAVKVDLVRLA